MKKYVLPLGLLVVFICLSYAPYVDGQIRNGGSGVNKLGGGSSSLVSGTTVITGGTDTSVCFDDAGVLNCGDTGFLFAKAANTITVLGNIELGHATGNTLSASSGVLSIEGVALLDVSSSQTITAGTKTFQGGTFTVKSTGSGNPAYFPIPALTALTGADNICAGTGSCAALTTGNQNVVIGSNAGDGATTGLVTSVLIGYNAGTGSNIGANNTAIGSGALDATTSTVAAGNTAVGANALGAVTSGLSNVGIGSSACISVTTSEQNTCVGTAADASGNGNRNVVIGNGATAGGNDGVAVGDIASAAGNVSIAIGTLATTTAANQMVVGGSAFQITDVYWSEGVTNATPLDVTHNATGGSGTDIAGAAYIVAGGKGTGAGVGGAFIVKTAQVGSTGTTLQSLRNRQYVYAGTKALTAGSATDVVRIALAQSTGAGGVFRYCVRASDATDVLVRCGSATWAAVNKSGTETCNMQAVPSEICADTVTPGTCAVSTLTAALTCTSASADTVDIEINSAAGITETTLNAEWSLEMNYGAGAITPQ